MTLPAIPLRVAFGAARLDVLFGSRPAWARLIDPDGIDMSSDYWCVLGQLFRTYERGLSTLGINGREADESGFDVPPADSREELNDAWLLVLAQAEMEFRPQYAVRAYRDLRGTGDREWTTVAREFFRARAQQRRADGEIATEEQYRVIRTGPASAWSGSDGAER